MKKLILVSGLVAWASVAAAQTTQPRNHDPNNPQRDPKSQADKSPQFDSVDTDRNGNLSMSEFDGAKMKGKTLAQFDKNGDGQISRDEWDSFHSNAPAPADRR